MLEEPQFHSMEEVREFIRKEAERQVARQRKTIEVWYLAKRVMWLLLLAGAYLQYFFIDTIYVATTLPAVTVSVPVPVPKEPPNKRTRSWITDDMAWNPGLVATHEVRES